MIHLSDFRVDSRIQRLATALADRGDEVDLFCLGERDEISVGHGVIRVHPVPCSKPSGGARSYLRGYGRFLLGAAARLMAADARRRYDVIEAHNMPDVLTFAAAVPRLRGTPVILNVHDTFPELFATKFGKPTGARLMRLMELEERLGARLADRVVTVTEEAQRRLHERGVGVGRTVVVMNSSDERVFGPPRPPQPIPTHGPVRVLYHGGLAPRFGVETLIRAAARLRERAPRISIRICGAGEDRERLAELAREIAPDSVELTPHAVPFAEIPGELRAAHVGVVPTLHDSFTELLLPVKLLEYVHMGLPAVTSRLPGIASYFGAEDVRFHRPGDPDDLADALAEVCQDADGADRRAAQASRRLTAIAWEHQRAGYLALVDELAGARRR
jgi:glycosyltransferase involved in cell wall biosynthesis